MAVRKIPQRKCVGCTLSKDKRELIRIVRSSDGEISVDFTGKKNGRGAYICKDPACLELARKGKKLEKAFGVPVESRVYDSLAKRLAAESD